MKIIYDDIRLEGEYWMIVVLYWVLGVNFLLQVMDGFIYRVWGR